MLSQTEVKKRANSILKDLHEKYRDKGLLSIYLYGSITSSDFNPATSDVDVMGILSDEADHDELMKIRDWLPKVDPDIKEMLINYYYLSELQGTGPIRSRMAQLNGGRIGVFDFPNWEYVCGQRFSQSDFQKVTPEQAVQDRIRTIEGFEARLSNPTSDKEYEFYGKSLVWLCYTIHKLKYPVAAFSWSSLADQTNDDTRELVAKLRELKFANWDTADIKQALPYLDSESRKLIAKYRVVD